MVSCVMSTSRMSVVHACAKEKRRDETDTRLGSRGSVSYARSRVQKQITRLDLTGDVERGFVVLYSVA